jgi:hypothetical protein
MPRNDVFPLSTNIEQAPRLVLQFFAYFIGASVVLAVVISAFKKYRDRNIEIAPIQRQFLADRDHKYALENLGEDSVYRFFLGTSKWGWFIVIATMVTQILILSVFVSGSKRDFNDSTVDMVYTWKCTRDEETCINTSDLNWKGWLAFAVLMVAHLLKDGISGIKMINYSVKQRHHRNVKIRLFIGGTLLTLITVFTTYVSIMYNKVIATSKLVSCN